MCLSSNPGFDCGRGRQYSLRVANAKPGFVNRMIVCEYATAGNDTYSCEKSFRRLDRTVVISG